MLKIKRIFFIRVIITISSLISCKCFTGYHGIRGPQTVHRPRYQSEMRNPLFEAVTSMGYRIVDPNGPFQTGKYFKKYIILNLPVQFIVSDKMEIL